MARSKRPRRQRGRAVDGILVLDKPLGMSSNAALQEVKQLFNAAKVGHTGSLDPLATGMLPLCFGEATKFSQFLLDSDKRYQVSAQLGVRTNCGDREGEVIQRAEVKVDAQQIDAALADFRGAIEQVPSMFSALKYQGQPLYELARQGINVERPARQIHVHHYELLAFDGEYAQFDVLCSKGTYVRTLIDDLGQVLGCGAHVSALRRLQCGPYRTEQMYSLEQLTELALADEPGALDQTLLPVASCVDDWPQLQLDGSSGFYLQQGQAVVVPKAPVEGLVALFCQDQFIGVGEILDDGKVAPRRLLRK